MRLSVSMIVRLEESCLAKCLTSVIGADELVIVDTRLPTDPPDRTREIAESFGAKLYDFPWVDDFAAARNFSLSKCTGDWVICIDADETLESGGVEKIRKAIEEVGDYKTIYVRAVSTGNIMHPSPRVFKRCPEVFWERAAHNYIVPVEEHQKKNGTDITITYAYSAAHKNDPDRTLRILTKELEKNPESAREMYYLAREYWDRRDYVTAAHWYTEYLQRATYAAKMADAWLMLAYCLWNLNQKETARDACLQSIKINADCREALLFMAEMSGPKNRERWKVFAEFAENEDVLFVRSPAPKENAYYDQVFAASKDMSRYEKLFKRAASWTWGRVLDICCGTGELGKYVQDYEGIDFSQEAVQGNPRLRRGDVFSEDLSGYDTYVMLEALEHLDDLALLRRLPQGVDVVFSVPSFSDPAHVRTYNEKILRFRFSGLLDIERIVRFNWDGKAWDSNHLETPQYILLVRARTRYTQ
jgi:glycosyltransferase involved in cell wall biosynthesis